MHVIAAKAVGFRGARELANAAEHGGDQRVVLRLEELGDRHPAALGDLYGINIDHLDRARRLEPRDASKSLTNIS